MSGHYDAIIHHIDDLYKSIEYEEVEGIRMYSGIEEKTSQMFSGYLSDHKPAGNLTRLKPSTLAANGMFSGVQFEEQEEIETIYLGPEDDQRILRIGCNYGVVENKYSKYAVEKPAEKKSNRGRKPKEKVSKRKVQGSGKYFASQLSFEIYSKSQGKVYNIKLFRNGKVEVPGVCRPDMHDLIEPIKVLENYLHTAFGLPEIRIVYFMSVMRNYKCCITDSNKLIELKMTHEILKKIKKSDNEPGIAEIQNNDERYHGIIVKFVRPISIKPTKKTTVKLLKSGKVNFDGGNSPLEVEQLHRWLDLLITENPQMLYDIRTVQKVSDDDYESLYDSS